MKLFHFSDDPNVGVFTPRPVRVPSGRPAGREWLNGPLVWAIDEPHQAMYLFPRECPRVLCWPTPQTTPEDRERWWGGKACRKIAHIEWAWFERLRAGVLYRYELPSTSFVDLEDAGMRVTREPVTPAKIDKLDDLPAELRAQGVELRVLESLAALEELRAASLHVSSLRMRNAQGYIPNAKHRNEPGRAASTQDLSTAVVKV